MKRACPYDANLLRMSKVHLMDYDVDFSALQKMHDNTIKKLKDGSRNFFRSNNYSTACSSVVYGPPLETMDTKKGLKQMEVTNYFNHVGNNGTNLNRLKASCDMKNTEDGAVCYYCDKKFSTNQCGKCGELFCDSCSLVRYHMAGEEYVCLSCS